MEINKNSWHYRAWAWSHRQGIGEYVPEQTNLCSYVRRLVIGVPLIALGIVVLILLASLLIVIPTNLAILPFGYYARHPVIEDLSGRHRPSIASYQGLKIGSFRLLPWHVIVPVLLVLLGRWNYGIISHRAFHGFGGVLFIMELIVLFMGLLVGGITLYQETGTGSLIREYVDAKAKGVCPLITFKDDE